jgi:hypothetical protein
MIYRPISEKFKKRYYHPVGSSRLKQTRSEENGPMFVL